MPTVLCIDDQELGLGTRQILLEAKGYEVLIARSGQDGLGVLAEHPDVAAVILDYSMPGMTGEEVAVAIRQRWPRMAIVMLSGYPDVPQSAINASDVFIVKGASPVELLSALERLTGQRPEPKVLPLVERSRKLVTESEDLVRRTQQMRKERAR